VLIEGAKLFFCKLDPKKPNAKFNKENPTWEAQLRTESKEQKKEWESKGLLVKPVVPDEEGAKPFWRVNLRKKSMTSDGEAADPVEVLNGKLKPVDPNSIGNGSVANVRIFQYEYKKKDGSGVGLVSVLMGIQLTKHIVYVPKPRDDDFQETETETIEPEETEAETGSDDKFD
jgi:hypothetical protein